MRFSPPKFALPLVVAGLVAAPTLASAGEAPTPVFSLETRLGGGAAIGGGGSGPPVYKLAPLSLSIEAQFGLSQEPSVSMYAGPIVESLDRFGFGAVAGVRARIGDGPVRVGGGGIAYLFPYTLWGASVNLGFCGSFGKAQATRLCLDGVVNLFFLGSDLPDGHAAGQALLVGSVGFDVL